VLDHNLDDLSQGWWVQGFLSTEYGGEIAEEPGAPQAASAHDDAIAAGLPHHPKSVPSLPDVAIAQYWDAPDVFFEPGN